MSERTQQETVELLREVKSVLSSINRSRHHQVEIEGDDPAYWQREEWVNWAVNEVLPRVDAALAAHIGEVNEMAQPHAMVPKGWRLVPEYPTDSMLAHGQDLALIQRHDGSAGYLANLEQVWAVMVCAAPKPSQEEQA